MSKPGLITNSVRNYELSSKGLSLMKKNLTKVTVSFGSISVVVPVSPGILVADLTEAAVLRYKKAVSMTGDKYVNVKYLRSAIGGILYNGDELEKVVDDREQIVAVYDVQEQTITPTDLRREPKNDRKQSIKNINNNLERKYNDIYNLPASTSEKRFSHEIETLGNVCNIRIKKESSNIGSKNGANRLSVGEFDKNNATCSVLVKNSNDVPVSSGVLIVRRGSEPALNGQEDKNYLEAQTSTSFKKSTSPRQRVKWNNHQVKDNDQNEPSSFDKSSGVSRFVRSASRKSHVSEEMLEVAAQLAEDFSRKESNNEDLNDQHFYTSNESHELNRPHPSSDDGPYKESLISAGGTSAAKSSLQLSNLQKANTRKMGKLLEVDLSKSFDGKGLGFTVTTRDNATIGDGFVCIKNILPAGPALKDGRLKEGDRILKINGIDVADFTKDKVVAMLRSIKEGEAANLIVSRQIASSFSAASLPLPRHISPERTEVTILDAENSKQRLTFDIPLNDSGSAGLGVSVKGRTKTVDLSESQENASSIKDCGIFIKLIIHGGAAFKDGRLKVNDQLIAINGVDLIGLSNKDAMNAVRNAMQKLSTLEKNIQLTVLRNLPSTGGFADDSKLLGSPGTPDGAASLLLETPRLPSIDKPMQSSAYDDYAVIVKGNSALGAPTLMQGSRAEERLCIEDDANGRTIEDLTRQSKHESVVYEDADFYQTVADPFVRDSRNRQSMSEKRHGASKLDPTLTSTYQQIVHQRQSSAPSLAGAKSAPKSSDNQVNKETAIPFPYSERRTLSLESVSTAQPGDNLTDERISKPLLHEQIARNVARSSNQENSTKSKFKLRSLTPQRIRESRERHVPVLEQRFADNDLHIVVNANSNAQNVLHSPTENPSASGSSASPQSNVTTKEKNRRKTSTGGLLTLKNLFRLGSGGKSSKKLAVASDASGSHSLPAESLEMSRRRAEEEQRRIRMYYERFRQHQDMKPMMRHDASPATVRCTHRFLPPENVNPSRPMMLPPGFNPSRSGNWPPQRPASPPIVLFSSLSPSSADPNHPTYFAQQRCAQLPQNVMEIPYYEHGSCRPDPQFRGPDFLNYDNPQRRNNLDSTFYPNSFNNSGPQHLVRPTYNNGAAPYFYHCAQRSEPAISAHIRQNRVPQQPDNRMPPIPPPDYEEYLRSVNSNQKCTQNSRRFRPSSEFIESSTTAGSCQNQFLPLDDNGHHVTEFRNPPGGYYDHYSSLPRSENYSRNVTRIRM